MNLERILARLKNERHRIDKAISALEKVRAAEAGGQGQGTAKPKKQRLRVKKGADSQSNIIQKQQHNQEKENKIVALAPTIRRVS